MLVCAGLRGGGWRGDLPDLLSAEIEGGPLEAARGGPRQPLATGVPGAGISAAGFDWPALMLGGDAGVRLIARCLLAAGRLRNC